MTANELSKLDYKIHTLTGSINEKKEQLDELSKKLNLLEIELKNATEERARYAIIDVSQPGFMI